MRKIDTSRKAKIVLVAGSSGSGKSAWTKKQITRAARLIVWDIEGEYSDTIKGIKTINKISDLARELKKTVRGKFAFVGNKGDFDAFCRCVFAWGDCVCVVEELAGVTTPAKAPDAWHTLVSRGRKYGIEIFAITQRPAESDKTIFGNATVIHVGRLTRGSDRAYMAREMDLPQAELDALKPLEWIERYQSGEKKAGKVTF